MKRLLLKPGCIYSQNDIVDLFTYLPRDKWYNILSAILFIDNDGFCSYKTRFGDHYAYLDLYFKLKDLKRDHFNVEPGTIVKHRTYKGQYVCLDWITFDKRFEESVNNKEDYARYIIANGSVLHSIGVNKFGKISGFDIPGNGYLGEHQSSYYHYCKSNYEPKYGQLLWYFKMIALNKVIVIDEEFYRKVLCNKTIDIYKDDHKFYEKAFKVTE